MEQADWESRWSEGRIGFNQETASPMLRRYADRVWGADGPERVLVPLCGKSVDMVFLAERGAAVVGVEYVEQGVRGFFAERELDPTVEAGPPPRYAVGPYTLFAADVFDMAPDRVGAVDAVLDRAALIALDPETRVRYAAHLASLLPAGTKMLLITVEYDQSEMSGPPFAVHPPEVQELFAGSFEIEALETSDIGPGRFAEQGVSAMREAAYELTRRGA
jgi:thiopurine S-methyltransferase